MQKKIDICIFRSQHNIILCSNIVMDKNKDIIDDETYDKYMKCEIMRAVFGCQRRLVFGGEPKTNEEFLNSLKGEDAKLVAKYRLIKILMSPDSTNPSKCDEKETEIISK